jgi:hypothetical protein
MGAASARAISSHRNPATRQGLERAVAWSPASRKIWGQSAAARDNEHDLSLSFSAGEEFKRHGDPPSQYAAAKRPNLL